MKPIKRIAILFAAVAGIALFWLLPNVNQANDVRYTRRYEDTDYKHQGISDSTKHRKKRTIQLKNSNGKAESKFYKKESIAAGEKLSKIESKMFSRAMQFEPELEIIIDSVEEVQVSIDSIEVSL
jgi:hypothetical protein